MQVYSTWRWKDRVPYGHKETIQITKISKINRTALTSDLIWDFLLDAFKSGKSQGGLGLEAKREVVISLVLTLFQVYVIVHL